MRRLLLVRRRPAHAKRKRWSVVFTLDHVLWLTIVEAEDLVVEVEPVSHDGETVLQSVATLGVELKVGVEIVVAERAAQSTRCRR